MVFKCCVPSCIRSKESTLHKLPNDADVQKRILNELGFGDNFAPSMHFRVCSDHFSSNSFLNTSRGMRLIDDPKVDFGEYELDGETEMWQALQDDKIFRFSDLVEFHFNKLPNLAKWVVHVEKEAEESITFYQMKVQGGEISVAKSILIRSDMNARVKINGKIVKLDEKKVMCWSELQFLLDEVNRCDDDRIVLDVRETIIECLNKLSNIDDQEDDDDGKVLRKLKLITNQLSNLISQKPTFYPETMVLAFLLRNISAASYKVLRDHLSLPSFVYLQRLSSKLDSMNNEKYFKRLASNLSEQEKVVTLQIDEIYVKQFLEYLNGKVFGMAESVENDEENVVARTIQAFMISSLFGHFKVCIIILAQLGDIFYRNLFLLFPLGSCSLVSCSKTNSC